MIPVAATLDAHARLHPSSRTRFVPAKAPTSEVFLDYKRAVGLLLVDAAAARKRGSLDEGIRLFGVPIEPHPP